MPRCALLMRASEPSGSRRRRIAGSRSQVGVVNRLSWRNCTAARWRARGIGVKRGPGCEPYFSWPVEEPGIAATWRSSVVN